MKNYILLLPLVVILIGYMLPNNTKMPVEGASKKDYNPDSFWYYPWGRSVTHKGVDIFAKRGANVFSTNYGLVLFSGNLKIGGNAVLVLSPKWYIHYFAHLESTTVNTWDFIAPNEVIGTVGDSGNAKGKQPHLHYAIVTPFPYFWKKDDSRQGWKKMFYLNPIPYLE